VKSALGLDLSTSATGMLLLGENGSDSPNVLFETELKPKKVAGMAAKRWIAHSVMTFIHDHKPDKIVLEGYGLNLKNASSIVPLVELGGLIRFCLHVDGLEWNAPTPGECKKFATGKGNSPKDVVMMHVFKRWGFTAATNNIADAYVCAAMGLASIGALPKVTKDMQAVISGMEKFTN
jgi:crossover junction endodeoxyribonuclease RuvC